MLLLLLGISILFLIFGLCCAFTGEYYPVSERKGFKAFQHFCYEHDNLGGVTTILSVVFTIVLSIALLIVGITYSESMVINDKIALYQEENQKIETSIDATVKQYQNYEQETFEKCKVDPTVVFMMYPELKSNELAVKQIELYAKNNEKIKKLKAERLDYKVYGWWLCFKK